MPHLKACISGSKIEFLLIKMIIWKNVTVAAVQMYCNRSREENIQAAEKAIRQAAERKKLTGRTTFSCAASSFIRFTAGFSHTVVANP